MSKAKEYLKRVGLLQSPYISQERVIKHLEAFANEQIEAITVTRCSTQLKDKEIPTFEQWKKDNLLDTNCYGGSYKHKLGWKTKEQLLEMYQRQHYF